jgi:hypothetical protein
MDGPRCCPCAMASPGRPLPRRHCLCRAVAAICTFCCQQHAVATLPIAYVFHDGAVCTRSMPTTMSGRLGKFCSNLFKFHSNFEWIPVRIFRIFRISSNLVSSEFFSKKNPRTLPRTCETWASRRCGRFAP